MQTIGERLEEARKRKGISLREAAEATKIRGDYLLKFESNQYDINLPEIYVRGFLRTYANFLKLSVDKITAAPQPLSDQTIILTALGPVDVQVKQVSDNKIIYHHTLATGEHVSILKSGAIYITYTEGRNLQIEINGKIYGMPTTGFDRAR